MKKLPLALMLNSLKSPLPPFYRFFVPLILVLYMLQGCAQETEVIELGANQSMSITGKGQGQDAVMNPFGTKPCIAVVENLGRTPFDVRVQKGGEIIDRTQIHPKQTIDIELGNGEEVYFDSEFKGRASVSFKKPKS